MRRGRAIALALGAAGAGAFERWTRRTRATSDEKRRRLPGDDLVPAPMWQATRAVTIEVPKDAVWPWLVQMGYPTHRAGWYIPVWIDRVIFGIRRPSARVIVPELQALAPGDRVADSPDGRVSYFTAAEVARNQALVLVSHTHPLPIYRDVDFSWAFILIDAGPGTRLVMRARISYTPVGPAPMVRALVSTAFAIGDVVQAGAMLGGIKARAEAHRHDPPAHPAARPAPPTAERSDSVAGPAREGGASCAGSTV